MANITAAMVKELRDATQLPMMECKKALQDADGDLEVARQKLREAGKKFMGKREDRATEEGRLAIFADIEKGVGSMIEIQCESAPVAGNQEFVQLANDLAEALATCGESCTPEALWSRPSPSKSGSSLEEQKDELQNKIREVFRLTRVEKIDAPCGGYVHHDGKSGALLVVSGGDANTAKDISMHITAMKPDVVNIADLDAATVEKERSTLMEASRKEGKPENIIEKMVEGRMRNFYAEHVLTEQPFIKDEAMTIGKLAAGAGMKVERFVMWRLGECSGSNMAEATVTV